MEIDNKKKKIIFFAVFGGLLLILLIILIVAALGGKADKKPDESSDNSIIQTQTDKTGEVSDETTGFRTDDTSALNSASRGTTGNTEKTTTANTSSGKTDTSRNTSTKKESTTTVPIKEAIDTSKYNLYTYSIPFWTGNIVYNESVYPMTTQNGENEVIQLLYDAVEIIEVRSSDLKKVYKAGVDYKLENGKLVIPKGSSIPVNSYNDYYLANPLANNSQKRLNGGYIYFSEGDVFHKRQIAVTYRHNKKWNGPIPAKQGSKLPKLQAAINNKDPLTIVYYGDSISCGANASSTVGAAPMAPSWPQMFTASLEKMGLYVTDFNTSMGGQISQWGVTNVQSKVIRYTPDLVVLGWGMNDGTKWNNVSPDTYKNNIKQIINKIRASLPDCEFILIGTMLPNPEAVEFVGPHEEYTAKLYEIQKEYSGVAVANMTEIHKYMLTRKKYRDMTGNNVNHPNDFLSRVYLQVLLETLSK